MSLPFTSAQFLDVFGVYNQTLCPAVAALWLVSAAATVVLVSNRPITRWLSALAALHWAWSGIAYHAIFFSRINAAAYVFAVGFVVQALLFTRYGIALNRLVFRWAPSPRHVMALVFLVSSLAYPLLVWISGHKFPRAPIFAVPCPTALFTAGILLAAETPVPRSLFAVPIAWCLIGGTAALVLGMTPDLLLFVAAVALAVRAVAPFASGWRGSGESRRMVT